MSKYPGRIVTDLAPAGYSVFFDGTGDYLTIANNAALQFGTGDFTFEAWVYPTNLQASKAAGEKTIIDMGNSGFFVSLWTGAVHLASWNVADLLTSSSAAVVNNTWFHVALSRSGTTVRCFVNGAIAGTATLSTNFNSSGSTFIGSSNVPSLQLQGYISNLRVIKGTALYTAAFTPPTQLFPITNTSLLTCQSPTIIDNSTNNFAITVNGNAAVSTLTPFTAYVPYNPALGASTPGVWTVDEAMQAAATRQWNMYDPNFQTTTLLLHGNGANNANNNTFLDSSTNNFTITRFGNTTQGTFSPFSQTGWSNFFNGTTDYLSAPAGTAFAFGTAAWTIEAWVYVTTLQEILVFDTRSSASAAGVGARIDANGTLFYSGSANNSLTTNAITANTWNHVAWVYDGTTLSGYVNGIRGGTATPSFNITQNNGVIGRVGFSASGFMAGYISNLRVVKGAAVYSGASFSVPAVPLGATSGGQTPPTGTQTSLLTCQSNRFVDNGGLVTPNTISVGGGTPSVQAFSPFYPTAAYTPETIGGSGYFDGSSDYLAAAGNAAFAFGTGDFTLEAWIYPNSISTGTFDRVCATSDFSGSGFDWTLNTGSSSLFLASSSYGFAINTRSWNHIVYTRSGTTLRGFLNGRLASYNTGVSQNITSTTALQVGQGYSGTGYNGYMTDLRIIKGSIPTTYQTSSTTTGTQIFTPPAAPLTTVSQGATAGNVSCLLNYTNAGVVDSTAKNVLETVGTAQISTAQSRFGGSSMLFNGTTDSMVIGPSPLFNFGASDLTIEFWAYTGSSATMMPLFSTLNRAKADVLLVQIGANGVVYGYATASGGATWSILGGVVLGTVTYNAWNHIALVRSGNVWNGYVNGVRGSGFPVTNSSALSAMDGFNLGQSGANSFFYNGYLDDLRISRFARYTGNFTPQTSQWQDQ